MAVNRFTGHGHRPNRLTAAGTITPARENSLDTGHLGGDSAAQTSPYLAWPLLLTGQRAKHDQCTGQPGYRPLKDLQLLLRGGAILGPVLVRPGG